MERASQAGVRARPCRPFPQDGDDRSELGGRTLDGAVLATDLVGYSRLVVAGKRLGLNIRLPRHAGRDVSEGAGLGRTPGFETDDLVVPTWLATLLIPAAGRHVREACGP